MAKPKYFRCAACNWYEWKPKSDKYCNLCVKNAIKELKHALGSQWTSMEAEVQKLTIEEYLSPSTERT